MVSNPQNIAMFFLEISTFNLEITRKINRIQEFSELFKPYLWFKACIKFEIIV